MVIYTKTPQVKLWREFVKLKAIQKLIDKLRGKNSKKLSVKYKNLRELLKKESVLKLHIGCGTVYKQVWINIDNNSDNNISMLDFKWDLRKPLPFKDNSVDFIFNEHFFEHLTVKEGQKAIKDFYRILKSGGVMRIAMPDLDSIVKNYLNANWKYEQKEFFFFFGLNFVQTRAELININFRWWGHKWLYDWEELYRRLKEAGCNNIKQCEIYKSEYSDLSNMETRNESTLIAEIKK